MNGFAHSTIGFGVGFAIAESANTDPLTTVLLIGSGALSALVPDLDINGKLTNRLALPHQFLKTVTFLAGCLVIYLSWTQVLHLGTWQGVLLGAALIGTSQWISKRFMLSLTGIIVAAIGVMLAKLWLSLFGLYIFIASFLPHRSYTHSLLGLAYYCVIAWLLAKDTRMPDLFLACSLGYASHLLADMKWVPTNKKGVKLLLPLSKKSF